MDSRVERVSSNFEKNISTLGVSGIVADWYDVDFPEVIKERKKYYTETAHYYMLSADAREEAWLEQFPEGKEAIIIMEGVSMYFERADLVKLLQRLDKHFATIHLFMDCYTDFSAKASKYKNPINDVGVTQVYGVDIPEELNVENGLCFVKEHEMTPASLIMELQGMERAIFPKVFAGNFAKKMYRLYEYRK